MWTTNGCTTRSQRRGGAPDRKTRRSRRPKGSWPPTSKRWKPISSARVAPGHDLIPSPVGRDAGGAFRPVGPSPRHATAAQSRAGAEEHTSELQSRFDLVCRLLLEKKKIKT